ncbi:PRD domain-containing protein, partial [Lactiplantibacillus plantarum]|uniref:PRD domain-containing protein n=2 Tax=Lactobacillaceae TaxID=33958 RepID=UPI000DBBEAE5
TDINHDLDIEIINVYSIFDKNTSLKLQSILLSIGESYEACKLLIDRLLQFLSIEGIRGRLQILNPNIVIEDSQDIVTHYENFYDVKFNPRLKLNLYMHLSLMIERMIMNHTSSDNLIKKMAMTSQERDFFTLSNGIFKPIEKKFNIEIQPYEIELIYQLIKDFIKNKN